MSSLISVFKLKFVILFLVFGFSYGQTVDECMVCHSDEELTKTINDSTELSLHVNIDVYKNSVHGEFECIDCHSSIKEAEHEENLPDVNCADCHEDSQKEYSESIHAVTLDNDKIKPAGCKDCHGTHDILSSDDASSKTQKLNIEKTCGNCHIKPEIIKFLGMRGQSPVTGYANSIHSKILHETPEDGAPTCTNCHGYHEVYLMSDYRSTFNKMNIPGTCGKCHEKSKEEYSRSIHWLSLKRGHYEAPVCNDCHGEHQIVSSRETDANTNRLNLSSQICAKCHSSRAMMDRFGLDPERFSSYMKTYHGLASLKGSPDAANCTSCHEVHAILGISNIESGIHPANLEKTCSKCHENVSSDFINIAVHPIDQKDRNPIAYYAENIYVWIIILVVGGMFIHNLIILIFYIRQKNAQLKKLPSHQRFLRFEVYQHAFLILSFFTLVITGFALKFPDIFWVELLTDIGMTEEIRALLHRIAAVVLIISSLLQLGFFIFHKKGRQDLYALKPEINDIKGFWANIKYYLGISKNRPKFGRWDYAEKAEYLALIWGTVLMVITGFVLWFPEFFIRILPTWIFEVSEIVHYYEAWLATLAIVVWHWFFVIFHPEKYPMNLAWMNGKVPEEEVKERQLEESNEENKND